MNRVGERKGRRGTEGGYDLSTDEHHYVSHTHKCINCHLKSVPNLKRSECRNATVIKLLKKQLRGRLHRHVTVFLAATGSVCCRTVDDYNSSSFTARSLFLALETFFFFGLFVFFKLQRTVFWSKCAFLHHNFTVSCFLNIKRPKESILIDLSEINLAVYT